MVLDPDRQVINYYEDETEKKLLGTIDVSSMVHARTWDGDSDWESNDHHKHMGFIIIIIFIIIYVSTCSCIMLTRLVLG